MNDECCNKTYACVIALAEELECDSRMNKEAVRPNEKRLPLTFPITCKMNVFMEKE